MACLFSFICEHYFLSVILVMALIVILKILNFHVNKFKQRKFAEFIEKFVKTYNKESDKFKVKLFAPLHDIQSSDSALKAQGKIRILEVGCGNGANLDYFPETSRLVMQDFNASFEPLLYENLRSHSGMQLERFVLGSVENMHDIPDESVDVVVATLLFCSVPDVAKGLSEIRRVLAPGGKFFFLEHVGAKEGKFLQMLQWAFTASRIWPYIFCGCELNRDTATKIKEAGFSSVEVEDIIVFSKAHIVFNFIKSQIMGIAVK